MLIVRLAKILMIAAVGAFAFMVTYDNFGSNYEFVRHVLSIDTTFSGNALMDASAGWSLLPRSSRSPRG